MSERVSEYVRVREWEQVSDWVIEWVNKSVNRMKASNWVRERERESR